MAHECPLDGCEVSFGTLGSVKAHMTAQTDEIHKGISGPAYFDENIEDAGDDAETSDSADTQDRSDAAQDDAGKSTGNPTFGDATPADSGSSTAELPCGHESYDTSDAPEPPYAVECDDCGQSWRVTEH